jgi:hypothetical protein
MIKLQRWSTRPSGQVLVATVFFCFIFSVLFMGVYKSGLLYTAKARATRATDLTSLSAGAVYANGMQLVRLTNVILMGFLSLDLGIMLASLSLTGGIANYFLPPMPFTKMVQTVQRVLFGVGLPTGAYPFLIFSEANDASKDNQLTNNWPSLTSWNIPIPPSPIFLFNFEGNLTESFLPNMALKFRTLDLLLLKLPKGDKPQRYYNRDQKTGKFRYYNANQVEDADNPKYPGQKRVIGSGKFAALEKEGEKAAEESEKAMEAEGKKVEKGALQKLKDKVAYFNLFKRIPVDVTDRDDPPNHTVLVYSSFPSTGLGSTSNALACVSETSVEGSGLAAWQVNDPPYCAKLKSTDPTTLAKYLNLQAMIQQAVQTGHLPSVSDMFNLAAGAPSK